ncbi:T9SS type A sorting domain-containing protein [Hymenobacter bucti]|uniref:T9SS type A sorting domain-containing protein n=1 Tax=Hymenobacter bucti TaxID=1844114 RepID=A0ABW4QWM0_9BACT
MIILYASLFAYAQRVGARAHLRNTVRRAALGLCLGLLALAAQAQVKPQLQLDLQGAADELVDQAYVYEQSGATTGFDSEYDAVKMLNSSGLNLASFTQDGQRLAINALPLPTLAAPLTISLFVGVPRDDQYTLVVSRLSLISAKVFLIDAQQQTRQLLTLGTTFSFSLAEAVPGGSYATSTRFSLVFEPTAPTPLPVTLVAFTAQRQGGDGLLEWTTASEQQNAYFQVESSSDGRTFTALGQIAGTGTSTGRHTYQFRDADLARYAVAQVYYRLRQVDTDGTGVYSSVRLLAVPAMALGVTAFPSPVPPGQPLHVLVRTATAGPAWLHITDAQGRRVGQRALSPAAGTSTITLPEAAQWAPGLYLVHVQQGAQQQFVKVSRP